MGKNKTTMVLTDEGKRIVKMTPYTDYWERKADHEARESVDIVACKHCGGPRPSGYRCTRCGFE